MKTIAGVLPFLFCSCLVPESYLVQKTSEELGVPQSSCKATTRPKSYNGVFDWLAVCDGREYSCVSVSGTVDCKETGVSEARTLAKIVVDRLALETNCPKDQIEIVSQSKWRRGSETAYRMNACGKPYICTTAKGRTDCKAALAQTPVEPAPASPAKESPSKE